MSAGCGVSVMIFTLNEETNLPACLASVRWCDDVIVVDSFSTDATHEICRAAGVRLFTRAFDGFGSQRNWALDNTEPRHDWILVLDADEKVTSELAREVCAKALSSPQAVGAYRLKRRFYMWGQWLRYSSQYPTWVVRLVHKERVRYIDRGHAETQTVDGRIDDLEHDLIDENAKGIDEWFERHNRYSAKDAWHETALARSIDWAGLAATDALRRRAALKQIAARVPGRALFYFLYSYLWRRGFLDGRAGLVYCLMKATYHQMIQIKKYDLKRRGAESRA